MRGVPVVDSALEQMILHLYNAGNGTSTIGKVLGISYQTALRVLRKNHIKRRSQGAPGGKRTPLTKQMKQKIAEHYSKPQATIFSVAAELDVSKNSVYKALTELGVLMKSPGRRKKDRLSRSGGCTDRRREYGGKER